MTLTPLDILSIIGLTADGISVWRTKRIKESREIYLSEVRDGVFANIDEDDVISISHRLWRAISEGMAKNNFRLLCRLIQGLGDNKKLSAPTFSRFASVLDSLTDEEIKVIALDVWLYNNPKPKSISTQEETKNGSMTIIRFKESDEYNDWKNKTSEIIKSLELGVDLDRYFDKLASGGKYIVSYDNPFSTTHYSLLRTGLYSLEIKTRQQNEAGDGVGRAIFDFSPLMLELMQYVDFCINHDKENKL